MMTKKQSILAWIFQLIIVAIFVMAIYPKFTSDPTSVAMFEALEMEPVGRYLIGSIEAISAFLLLFPRRSGYGALLAMGVMIGAVIGHVTILGFEGERGVMFGMATVSLVCASAVVVIRRKSLPVMRHILADKEE